MLSHLSLIILNLIAFHIKHYYQQVHKRVIHIFFFTFYINWINHVSLLHFSLLCLSEKELTPIEVESIVESADDWEEMVQFYRNGIGWLSEREGCSQDRVTKEYR